VFTGSLRTCGYSNEADGVQYGVQFSNADRPLPAIDAVTDVLDTAPLRAHKSHERPPPVGVTRGELTERGRDLEGRDGVERAITLLIQVRTCFVSGRAEGRRVEEPARHETRRM
jgi:hypothetical protein